MALLLGGIGATVLAAVLLFMTFAPPKVAVERRRPMSKENHDDGTTVLTSTSNYLVARTDRLLREASWAPVSAHDLELAGLAMTPGAVVVSVVAVSAALLILTYVFTASVFLAVLLALLVPAGAKIALVLAIDRRQKAFTDQLDETLQIIASSLRAGHSFQAAVDAVAQAAEPPTSEEFTRVINEHRIGRDLIVALTQTADRMNSEDFRWVAEAVAVHRETGGNLNEIIDRVGATMRERRQVREQVYALSAEGRFSAIVLMLLPPIGAGAFVLLNPGYMDPLVTTTTGKIVIACSLVMYVIGGFWIKKLVDLEY
ncbi:type II secretion system F family protein [Aeromicrobium terrae]|uniref:Type II secretion system protein F n=1 Tax=Aeromicrobium terrae TaxID=2498846 RepID=A0A5C8NK38_9ACTN|nr:type II secretion system F family protein [Aeromicrobium terrae]TXL62129.1 type II secretion system protein F [Aeromicrobium terrae]